MSVSENNDYSERAKWKPISLPQPPPKRIPTQPQAPSETDTLFWTLILFSFAGATLSAFSFVVVVISFYTVELLQLL